MTCHYLPHQEIDKARWDQALQQTANAELYACAWYLDAMCGGRWDALISADYKALFPLPWNRKWSIPYIYTPFFTQQLGLFAPRPHAPQRLQTFLHHIPGHFKLVELNLNSANREAPRDFHPQKRLTHHLRLDASQDELQKGFSDNVKRNRKKAEKAGLQLTESVTPDMLLELFRNYLGKHLGMHKPIHYHRFGKVMREAIVREHGKIWGVANAEGQPVAAAFTGRFSNKLYFLMNAATPAGRQSGAMHYLLTSLILHHANQPLTLDFEGSVVPSVARFYKSFGAAEIVYLRIRQNRLPRWLRWAKK